MPIKRERRWLYPIDWRELSGSDGRAGAAGALTSPGSARESAPAGMTRLMLTGPAGPPAAAAGRRGIPLPYSHKVVRIVLACARLDHDPANVAARNLMALCSAATSTTTAPSAAARVG